ncbi:flagellar hook-associated protein FlgL [Pseudoxanthomonas sp. J35]|uniref:flagellar hook-associated protein FlgL n=1 Tax=Pseudoxanthomonas sp. J35 TaxID=935852 RepID=UPI00048B905C|nr:flagellar hook-associated protein FlgL [Pseudoxanthomonas sp. J35]
MNGRISTAAIYQQSVSLMLGKQARLSHLQQQLATGQKLVTAKDDPVAAGAAVGLDRALAALEQFGKNANTVQNRLGLQENALQQAGELMAQVNDLAIQANSAALSNADRKAIAAELAAIHDSLLSLANSTDGAGRYLFAGAADDTAPFSQVAGRVVYNGDQTQRRVEVAPGAFVDDALPGSEIFMRIRTGDGTVDAQASPGNTGTGLLMDYGRAPGTEAWDGRRYTVEFTAPDAYRVVDEDGNEVATGAYADGAEIAFAGLRLTVAGQPAAGDSFGIGPSASKDVFATIADLVQALNADPATPAQRAAMQNALQAGMRDVRQAAERMIDARAAGGAQLAAIDDAAELRASNEVTFKTTLSSLRDLDYAAAIGQFQLEQAALQAAQNLFVRMQGMSLFDRLR